jgi:hypothetical protein
MELVKNCLGIRLSARMPMATRLTGDLPGIFDEEITSWSSRELREAARRNEIDTATMDQLTLVVRILGIITEQAREWVGVRLLWVAESLGSPVGGAHYVMPHMWVAMYPADPYLLAFRAGERHGLCTFGTELSVYPTQKLADMFAEHASAEVLKPAQSSAEQLSYEAAQAALQRRMTELAATAIDLGDEPSDVIDLAVLASKLLPLLHQHSPLPWRVHVDNTDPDQYFHCVCDANGAFADDAEGPDGSRLMGMVNAGSFAGMDEEVFPWLIRTVVVDTDYGEFLGQELSWSVQPGEGESVCVVSFNVGVVADNLTRAEAAFLMRAGRRERDDR